MTEPLRDLAIELEGRAFLGSREVFQEAWDTLTTVDGRSDTCSCIRLMKCCETCIGSESLARQILESWPGLTLQGQVNIAYAVNDPKILSDDFWLDLFEKASTRVQHRILAGFAQTALRGDREKKELRKLLARVGRYDTPDRQQQLDNLVKRILHELGS